jgi:hypothetical protein
MNTIIQSFLKLQNGVGVDDDLLEKGAHVFQLLNGEKLAHSVLMGVIQRPIVQVHRKVLILQFLEVFRVIFLVNQLIKIV